MQNEDFFILRVVHFVVRSLQLRISSEPMYSNLRILRAVLALLNQLPSAEALWNYESHAHISRCSPKIEQ